MKQETFIQVSTSSHIDHQLLKERKLYLGSMVDESSAEQIVTRLMHLELTGPGVPVHFYLNCPGGMVTAGYAIYDMMQSISSPVYTYCIGFAASMGSILLSGGAKGKRFIFPNAEVMIHQPAIGGFRANSADIEINARQIAKTKDQTAALLAANCGQTKQRILRDFDRDYWMNAREAVAYGIVDHIVAD